MKTKTKKIFSLSVLVFLCIAVFGLVGAVSAQEDTIETILNNRYGGSVNWIGPLPLTEISFTQTTSVVLVYVDDHQAGNTDPTGWYETDSGIKHQLFATPTKDDNTQFNPCEEFGMYIDSHDSQSPPNYYTIYSQNSKNPDGGIYARLYQVTGGDHSGAYVVAFEDLLTTDPNYDGDFNDVVLELKNVNPIPEFATIAIPAVAVLGLFLFFNKRKHKKE
ncbi:hypothetical protein C5S31_08010 [ANME-1 cluster archaeon GoMg2]|nr:hypothetical protein [ANME-1 cluster archaeon GoMg2]